MKRGSPARQYDTWWPGSLTIVLSRTEVVPDIVTTSIPPIDIRRPPHLVALQLIGEAKTSVAAPSANFFGYLSPTTTQHMEEQLGQSVDIIPDGGNCLVGVQSTTVDSAGQEPVVLRPLGLVIEETEKVTIPARIAISDTKSPLTSGQLPRHYSPELPSALSKARTQEFQKENGWTSGLRASRGSSTFREGGVSLSSGDLWEAAANFPSRLHGLNRVELERGACCAIG